MAGKDADAGTRGGGAGAVRSRRAGAVSWVVGGGAGVGRGLIDPGMLFVLAGGAMIAACVLIPALDELEEAEHERDVARAVAAWQAERAAWSSRVLDGLADPDETVVRSLAARELNLAPAGSEAVVTPVGGMSGWSASVAGMEPGFSMPVRVDGEESLLGRMVRGERSRLWLMAGGALCVLVGLVGVGRDEEVEEG